MAVSRDTRRVELSVVRERRMRRMGPLVPGVIISLFSIACQCSTPQAKAQQDSPRRASTADRSVIYLRGLDVVDDHHGLGADYKDPVADRVQIVRRYRAHGGPEGVVFQRPSGN